MNPLLKNKSLVYLLPLLCLGVYYIVKSVSFLPHDFANYYFGASFLENGKFLTNIYDPTWFNLKIHSLQQGVFASYAPNTPFLALFFLPFTILNFTAAKLLFGSLSLVLFLYTLKNLFQFYSLPNRYMIWLPVILFIPIKNNILFGQVYLLLFFLISEGFLAYKKKKYIHMGILWSVAIFLKIFPVILFAFLIFNKKLKALIYLGACSLVILTLSVTINGFDSWLFFLENVLPKSSRGEISGEFVKNYQSILMFLKHFFVFNEIKNPNPIINSAFMYHFFLALIKLIVLGYGILITYKNSSDIKALSYWILATYLLSPYGSSYGNILLIFILVYSISKKIKPLNIIILLVSVFIIANISSNYYREFPLPLSFLKLLLFLLITIFLFISTLPKLKSHYSVLIFSLIAATILTLAHYNKPAISEYHYLLDDQHQPLIYDYDIENNELLYTYWTIDGSKTKNSKYKLFTITYDDLNIQNSQIYYKGIQITNTNSNKLKPAIINENELIYLSDYDRGFGFYAFRKINLNK